MPKKKEEIRKELEEAVNNAVKEYISNFAREFDSETRKRKSYALITAYGSWERGLFNLEQLSSLLERISKS